MVEHSEPLASPSRLTIGQVIDEERIRILESRAILQARAEAAGLKSDETLVRQSDFPAGLALSGGGVRSATFNLGVLQALAQCGLLVRFDYLSTVSGGGYIGAWLSAWIHRKTISSASGATPEAAIDALVDVQRSLAGDGETTPTPTPSSSPLRSPVHREPRQMSWLRTCSRYLAPRSGALSIDSVTLATTWLRNVLLNALIILALLALVLLGVRLLAGLLHDALSVAMPLGEVTAALGAIFFASFAVQLHIQHAEPAAQLLQHSGLARYFQSHRWTLTFGFAYLVAAGLWAATFQARQSDAYEAVACGVVISVVIGLFAAGAVSLRMERAMDIARGGPPPPAADKKMVREAFIFVLAGLVSVSAAVGCFLILRRILAGDARNLSTLIEQLTFAPALALVTFGVCGSLFVGVAGRVYGEGSREWWARLNASFLRASLIALVVTGLTFGAGLVDWILEQSSGWLGALVASGWLGSAAAALFGSKVKTKTEERQRLLMSALNICAIVFASGLVLLASHAIHNGLREAGRWAGMTWQSQPISDCGRKVRPYARGEEKLKIEETRLQRIGEELHTCLNARTEETAEILLHQGGREVVWYGLLFCLGTFLLLGWRVDVNRFSLHDLYKVRLIRCYLGASRLGSRRHERDRTPNSFTGFDPDDDFELADISPHQRPLHLLNAAVNLTLDTHLAWQDRKAASFTFSTLHCGFVPPSGEALVVASQQETAVNAPSFIRTREYGRGWDSTEASVVEAVQRKVFSEETEGLTLGSAVATSGAAVSPTSGANTKPALAFLLTIFNLRTGRWSPNPRARRTNSVSPRFGPWWLLRELFGFTSTSGEFVHLSDGGHFDNLGIYELVRRRCKLIVCVDASADPNRHFSDLGNAVRRCRVDFGFDIDIDTRQLGVDPATKMSAAVFVEGTVDYGDGEAGRLLYIKPGLMAEFEVADSKRAMSRDILSHQVVEPTFPHVTTGDQFFSELQFESYRKLGECAGLVACSALRTRRGKR